MENRMSQNGINFFGWIRDGVKQSVLLGVSDAIETIGTPADASAMHPQVAALMKPTSLEPASGPALAIASHNGTVAKSKKRLGRSLRDIEPHTGS
jgi:hypothetical protein